MRISDWSSDVCSSDLQGRPLRRRKMDHRGIPAVGADQCAGTPARAEVEGLQKATGSEVLALLQAAVGGKVQLAMHEGDGAVAQHGLRDRKSTRLNSSH